MAKRTTPQRGKRVYTVRRGVAAVAADKHGLSPRHVGLCIKGERKAGDALHKFLEREEQK